MHVDVVASALHDFKGVVLLDPVIGEYKKGLFVSEETARAIRDMLVPMAQVVTPNRFEAEVLLGTGDAYANRARLSQRDLRSRAASGDHYVVLA